VIAVGLNELTSRRTEVPSFLKLGKTNSVLLSEATLPTLLEGALKKEGIEGSNIVLISKIIEFLAF